MKRSILPTLLLVAIAFAWGQDAIPPTTETQAGPPSSPTADVCRYCHVSLEADDFCHWCGRLARTSTVASRFWGDMTYLIRFPPRNTAPTIVTELSERGLAREEVSLPTGDRYTTTRGKEGWEVEGHINYGQTIKGSDFKALVTHTIQAGHLESREVHGQISGKSDYHFYRRLDYIYSGDGSLERIRFSTSLYANASDWKKEPASWLRHAAGEIVMVREQGVLVRIETSEREGRRSLRGEPEYADPVVTVESLRRATNGAIDSLVSVAR